MAEPPSRGLLDASVLIADLNREEGRYESSPDLLTDAEEGRLALSAPMVTQVEVTRWSQEVDPTDAEARSKLEAFLNSDWLQAVEVDRRMAKIAQDVVATTPVRTGIDALYIATAVIVEARTVFTWDDRLQMAEYEGVQGASLLTLPRVRVLSSGLAWLVGG